jgi:hypothetical protein
MHVAVQLGCCRQSLLQRWGAGLHMQAVPSIFGSFTEAAHARWPTDRRVLTALRLCCCAVTTWLPCDATGAWGEVAPGS